MTVFRDLPVLCSHVATFGRMVVLVFKILMNTTLWFSVGWKCAFGLTSQTLKQESTIHTDVFRIEKPNIHKF